MLRKTGTTFLMVGVLVLAIPAAADDTAFGHCVSIDNAEDRLACYDAIAGRESRSEETDVVAPITDDYGAEQLDTDNPNRKVEKPVEVKVTSCRRDQAKKFYFYLENGQVWKQNDDDRLRYKKCNFKATIVRDGFGYKMQIEGQKQRTRVKRVQ